MPGFAFARDKDKFFTQVYLQMRDLEHSHQRHQDQLLGGYKTTQQIAVAWSRRAQVHRHMNLEVLQT